MAYTSAITICSAKSLTEYSPQWTSYISVVLAFLTLGMVAWNYKGRKTIIALILISIGIYFIIQSEIYSGQLAAYYWGSAILFAGIWVNGNLSYFVHLFTAKASRQKPVLHHG